MSDDAVKVFSRTNSAAGVDALLWEKQSGVLISLVHHTATGLIIIMAPSRARE
jgi:hypothetical protein